VASSQYKNFYKMEADLQQQQQATAAAGFVHHSGAQQIHHDSPQAQVIPGFIVLVVFASIIGLQFLVQLWKRVSPKSYNAVTLFLMWLIPALLSFSAITIFWRFAAVWLFYTVVSLYLFYLASRPTLAEDTPRYVSQIINLGFFAVIFNICYFLNL